MKLLYDLSREKIGDFDEVDVSPYVRNLCIWCSDSDREIFVAKHMYGEKKVSHNFRLTLRPFPYRSVFIDEDTDIL